MKYYSIFLIVTLILCFCDKCTGIIYQLNETEYEKLPVLYELENYDLCMEVPASVYCVASLELYGSPDNKIYSLIQEYSQHRIKHYNYSKIDRGVCVTTTCTNYIRNASLNSDKNIGMILEKCLNDRIREKYDLDVRIYRLNCDRYGEVIEIDSLDYIVLSVIIILCTAVVIGSFYDIRLGIREDDDEVGKGGQFLQSFSVLRNVEQLMNEGDNRLKDLRGFHIVRLLGQVAVIYCHSYMFICVFVSHTHTYEKVYENPLHRVLFSMTSIVQIFFIMSGFLLTYFLEINAEKRPITWKSLPKKIFQRWWRLTPSIAFVLGIVVTWFRHLGSGPLWKHYILNSVSKQCREFYWGHIFFLNNLIENDILCSLQSWHIAADIQMYIPCLILHFAIRNRSLRFKLVTLSLVLLLGIAGPIAHVWLQDLDGIVMLTPEFHRTIQDDTFRHYHILPHNNIAGFVIGMANGYIVYYMKKNKVQLPNLKIGSILCWLVIPLYIGVFYVASLFFVDMIRPPLILRVIFAASHRVVIGLLGSVWIIGIILGNQSIINGSDKIGFVKALMRWRVWVIPSKLSYGVYLIHVEVINYLIGTKPEVLYFSFQNIIFIYIGIVVVSNGLAIVLYFLVEAPSSQLIKVFMGDKTPSKCKKD